MAPGRYPLARFLFTAPGGTPLVIVLHRLVVIALAVVVATAAAPASAQTADTIYTGGPILTMRGEKPEIAEALARMKAQAAKVPPGGWIVGFGYQAKKLAENRTPSRAELDTVSTTVPVLIVDSSGHLGAGNSKVFEVAGITADTPDPAGGAFARGPDGKSLAGPMEETALNAIRAKRPPFTGKLAADAITGAARVWASYGQTTAMEAGLGLGNDDIDIVLHAMAENLLPIDLYVAAKDSNVDAALAAAYRVDAAVKEAESGTGSPAARLLAARPDLDTRYVNRVRLGGITFWLDGSLDTAWMKEPYAANPPGKEGEYRAYRQIPDEVLDAAFDRFWPTSFQIHMHINGDAVADQALAAIEKAVAKHGMRDHRPVFVHELKEERSKGTLEPGKLADLVILGKNPLDVPTDSIGAIPVVGTIKEGKTIWPREE